MQQVRRQRPRLLVAALRVETALLLEGIERKVRSLQAGRGAAAGPLPWAPFDCCMQQGMYIVSFNISIKFNRLNGRKESCSNSVASCHAVN